MSEPIEQKRRPGRPNGSRNKVSKEAQNFFRRLLNDKDFQRNYKAKFKALDLSPQEYINARAYAWGKPVDQINLEASPDAAGALTGPITVVINGKTYGSGDGGSRTGDE
jgi:hypothetical protein